MAGFCIRGLQLQADVGVSLHMNIECMSLSQDFEVDHNMSSPRVPHASRHQGSRSGTQPYIDLGLQDQHMMCSHRLSSNNEIIRSYIVFDVKG